MPGVWTPKPGMYLDRLQELFEASIENVHGEVPPGTRCDYSPLVNHVLMGTALVRTDPKGRNYQTLLHEDLFAPLGMDSTSMGLRADLAPRHVKPDMRGTVPIQHLSRNLPGDHALFEDPDVEAPHVGCASTSGDLYRFAEMLRRGGELDGVRILSPRDAASWRGRSTPATCPTSSTSASPRTPAGRSRRPTRASASRCAAPACSTTCSARSPARRRTATTAPAARCSGSIPARDVSFALCSAGVMTQAANIERCQKLSDLALSAMI